MNEVEATLEITTAVKATFGLERFERNKVKSSFGITIKLNFFSYADALEYGLLQRSEGENTSGGNRTVFEYIKIIIRSE